MQTKDSVKQYRIPRVVREVCDEGLAVPAFEGGEVDLVVNIYRKGIGPGEDRTATDATNSATNATVATEIATNETELTEDEKLIIVAVKQNPSITQQALHNQTGITIGTIKRILPRLQEKGVLIIEGNRRSGNWKVIKQMAVTELEENQINDMLYELDMCQDDEKKCANIFQMNWRWSIRT